MSLPVTRRIARAALLIAAGTAPVVGAAGSASALSLPPKAPLSNPDANQAVNNAAEAGVGATGALAEGTLHYAVPTLATALGTTLLGVPQVAQESAAATSKPAKAAAAKKGANLAKKAVMTAAKKAPMTVTKKAPMKKAPAAPNKGALMIGGIPLG